MTETIISHVRPSDSAIQTNAEHSKGVEELAGKFAREFSMEQWGRILGRLHDLGKERQTFQSYIRKVTGVDESDYRGDDKQHAFVGALVASKLHMNGNPILPFAISGHHRGLTDYTDLKRCMQMQMPKEINVPLQNEILTFPPSLISSLPALNILPNMNKGIHHIGRMLFSCLVDADYLDTERFMSPEEYLQRGNVKSIKDLKPLLDAFLDSLRLKSEPTPINKWRQKIQQACIESGANSKVGITYSLTIPTGAGKTLSSLAWAMEHCLRHGKQRIIIAIPYTSIVTQTAKILSDIFGRENVLEHHSGINPQDITGSAMRMRMKLATENWDFPIIVTTNVQLFESMFSSKPSKCRKL